MFELLEKSAYADWFLLSMWGFPTFIAIHSVGMAIAAGLGLVLSLRYFGFRDQFNHSVLQALFRVAWIGFFINLVTGLALLASRISEYLFDPTFLVKMAFVLIAVFGMYVLHRDFRLFDRRPEKNTMRVVAAVTVTAWVGAITTGRWIAYLSGLYG